MKLNLKSCAVGLAALFGLFPVAAWELNMAVPLPEPSVKRNAALIENKGKHLLRLRGNAVFQVTLPAEEFAGKRCGALCEYKLEGVSSRPEKRNTHGFKVTAVYEAGGKKVWAHDKPVCGNVDWSVQNRRLAFPADLKTLTFSVSIPDGQAWIRRLELKVLPAPKTGDAKTAAGLQTLVSLKDKPVIDGRFTVEEWAECAADHNFLSRENGMKSGRDTSFFYGYDEKYFYFCQTSALPPAPQKIAPDDRTELEFLLPGGGKKTFSFRADGKHDFPAGTLLRMEETGKLQTTPGQAGKPCWLTEAAIPWSAFGLSQAPEKTVWKMQVRRLWRNPDEITLLAFPAPYLDLRFGRDLPMAATRSGVAGVSARTVWRITNPLPEKRQVRLDLLIRSVEAPHKLNHDLTVPPGGTAAFEQYFMVGGPQDRNLAVTVTDVASGKPIYARAFDWNTGTGKGFIDPDPPVVMNFGLAPSANRLIAKVETKAPRKLADVEKIRFKLVNADNILIQTVPAVRKAPGYFFADWRYPELTPGKYTVAAEIFREKGKKDVLSKTFQIRPFLWEYSDIGVGRTVPPPFRPLKSSGNRVQALLTGYEAGGVFWDRIFAQGKDILAGPVTLKLDGKILRKESEKWIERSADLAVRVSRHAAPDMTVEVRHEYEFDGMCKTILKFRPEAGAKCRSLYIDIPLKPEYARLYHHTASGIRSNPSAWIPVGEGRVWSYVRKSISYPFYIWFGETFKGFCHFSDMTPPLFDNVPTPVTHEIIRQKDKVTLRIHLAPGPAALKPFEYVCGFQPTPVKPRPASGRQWGGGFWTAVLPNAYMYVAVATYKHYFGSPRLGLVYGPYHNDWSFLDYIYSGKSLHETREQINARAAALLKKHGMTNEKWEHVLGDGHDRTPVSDRMRQVAIFSRNKLLSVYLNPRAGFRSWPESETYDDEWMSYGFRAPDDSLYHRHPVKSFTDKLLYEVRAYLRRFPKCAGLYFDNLYPSGSLSPFHGARELAPGQYEMVSDIFPMREMMKRALRLAAQEKRFLPGEPDYPWVEAHMTDANIVPVMGLATRNLNWEMKFGRQDWQVRFPESFHLVQSLGTQTGTVPLGIVATGGTKAERLRQHRTLYAAGFAFDMINFTDPGSIEVNGGPLFNAMQFLVRNFGYGTKEVEHFPGYLPESNPVRCTPAQVRITTLKHRNGKAMLLVGNLGKAAQVKLDLRKLPLKNLKNAETGKDIDKDTFFLPEHDCAVLAGEWK